MLLCFGEICLKFSRKKSLIPSQRLEAKVVFFKEYKPFGKWPSRKLNCERQPKDLSETSLKSFQNPSSFFVGLEAFSQAIYYISLTSVSSSENRVVYDSHDFCPHDFHFIIKQVNLLSIFYRLIRLLFCAKFLLSFDESSKNISFLDCFLYRFSFYFDLVAKERINELFILSLKC